ncbi:MAG: 50S ribosomal protein L19 [Candidatus Moranbacteria bacterium GW2011_GWE1_36_7]|nr:MAG: 50S ribosomal protein L19 [Candidatus Moranbacteria bacterium GW2011_GWD2_36_12]KKQ04453.1 MAG: 50S ribosomal protein L19 [Candidatus Moranbacteria bacterium GW2011_GWE2_36_40]KKQ11503.1 MAG: 50S ribosomal protein L19 [Candidatus Moranbacteria bacterium GW2011_GWE1_36_7]
MRSPITDKRAVRRLKCIEMGLNAMNNKLLNFNDGQKTSEMPAFRAGDVVKVFRKIIEGGKERIQIFEGMVIAVKGKQSSSTMLTVRKVSNGVGVEIVVPIQSPTIEKIEVVKRAKVRQSKLYFVRERSAKSLKMKYSALAAFAKVEEEKETAAEKVVEEVKEETPAETKAE